MQSQWLNYPDSGSRSHFKVMGFMLEFRAGSISPEAFERSSLNFTHIFLSVRCCAEPMTWLHRLIVKVTLQVYGIYPSISCPLYICRALWTIIIKLHPYVLLSDTVCRTINSATQTRAQDHGIYPWISCPLHIPCFLWTIFIKLHSNVPLNKTVCKTHDSA